jgi:hypothetical protein
MLFALLGTNQSLVTEILPMMIEIGVVSEMPEFHSILFA